MVNTVIYYPMCNGATIILSQRGIKMKSKENTRSLVITAFFAAIVFLGIQMFRIPLPAAVGTPFLHFGHIFVMLAVLCIGPFRSAVAGTAGLIIFDIVNGYMHAIPNVLVSTIIKCLFVGCLFLVFKKAAAGNKKKEYTFAIISAAIYGVTNIVLDFIWNTVELVIMGSGFKAAFMAELTSIPATIINAVFTVVGIAVLYMPAKAAYSRIVKK